MITNLTEQEREAWKDAYKLHEKFHDMTGTEEEWKQFALDMGLVDGKYENDPKTKRLARALLFALCDWFEGEQKISLAEAREAPEQLAIDEVIPWT